MKVFFKITTLLLILISYQSFAAFNNNPSSVGADSSGAYRNLAQEMGKTNIQQKVNSTFDNMFGYNNTQQLYYPYTENGVYKAHYIKAINPDEGDDIRTEGQSWGMTAAVMLNKQEEFDNLWRFAKAYQKNPDNHPDVKKQGVYAWKLKLNQNGFVYKVDEGPAPDGEEYFAFALLNASARWGNSGEFNYYNDAITMLNTIKNKLMENQIIRFSPYIDNLTDPSYHIPAFYDYFSNNVTYQVDKTYWRQVATKSRTLLKNHFTKVSGSPQWNLPTFLSRLDGSPVIGYIFNDQANPGQWYEFDAWRVIMNVGLDAHLMGAQAWHKSAVNKALGFLSYAKTNNSNNCYEQVYSYGGAQNKGCAGEGQKAANAVALLASTNAGQANEFFNEFWSLSQPTGDYRYYNGSLYMLAMLHVSGNFKFYNNTFN